LKVIFFWPKLPYLLKILHERYAYRKILRLLPGNVNKNLRKMCCAAFRCRA
jgi:hypothetical protein